MADIKHAGVERTEGDGISYKGLAWSMIILTAITLFCYAFVVGFFKFMESRAVAGDVQRAPLADAASRPVIRDGQVIGSPAPGPTLLVNEPVNLEKFRATEEHQLSSYGWEDQNTGVVRLPIDRAKTLLLERGLPVREGAPVAVQHDAAPAAAQKAGEPKAAPPKAGGHK